MDLRKATPSLWLALGEAQSKCEHIAGVPLRPATAHELHQLYLAKGIQATTAIEGNTLSEDEVRNRIEGRLELPPSKEYQGREVDNILEASNSILEEIARGQTRDLTPERVKEFNRMVLKDLDVPDHATPGEITKKQVGVGTVYKGAPVEDCEYLLEKLCAWLASDEFKPPDSQRIVYGLVKAIIAHVYLVWIHPFGDGNGRTARLMEVKILLEAGVPSSAAHLLSNYYNQTRMEYYRQLDRASKSGGDLLPFIKYAIDGFLDQVREQIQRIRYEQWDVAWRNYVHERFRDRKSRADGRRRRLALAISAAGEVVAVSELRRLDPRVAEDYANKTNKTVTRDLNVLRKLGLIERAEGGIRAKKEGILAFLPVSRFDP
ncbi:MAG: Fic family protein [Alphaproteobacteria bacterium]